MWDYMCFREKSALKIALECILTCRRIHTGRSQSTDIVALRDSLENRACWPFIRTQDQKYSPKEAFLVHLSTNSASYLPVTAAWSAQLRTT